MKEGEEKEKDPSTSPPPHPDSRARHMVRMWEEEEELYGGVTDRNC